MITAIIFAAVVAGIAAIASAGISQNAQSEALEQEKALTEASLAQSEEQFATSNYLNSTGFQVSQNTAAGINSDFQSVSSQGASSNAVDYGSIMGNLGDAYMQNAQANAEIASQAAQQISSLVSQSIQVGSMSQEMKTASSVSKISELEYRSKLQEFADNYVIENTDVSSFDNYDVFGNKIDVLDRNGDVIGWEYENFDDLSLETFYNSDEYLQYLENGGKRRYSPDEFASLGFGEKDSEVLSRIASSSLGRSNVRKAIYDKYSDLVSSRFKYDVSKCSPFNRKEYSDIPSVVSDYSNAIFDTTMSRMSADLEQNKDRALVFGSRNKLKVGDLETKTVYEDYKKTISYLSTLNNSDFGSFLAQNDIQAADLQRSLQSVNDICLQAQLDVARSAINSNNAWARQYGFYQLNCLQNGRFAPLETAKDVSSLVGDAVSDFTSLGKFFSTAQSLGKSFSSSSENFGSLYY